MNAAKKLSSARYIIAAFVKSPDFSFPKPEARTPSRADFLPPDAP
jgi:hypothetical protein